MTEPSTRAPAVHVVARWLAIAIVAITLGFWAFALLLGTATAIVDSHDAMSQDLAETNDFPMFYAGGENVVSAGREHTYEKPFIVASILKQWKDPQSEEARELLPWLRYYNPPFYLFAMSPLTVLDMHEAYIATVATNVLALGALIYLIGIALQWRRLSVFFVALATLGFLPLTSTIYHGQPTLLIAVLALAAFLSAEKGKSTVSALLITLCAAKPQLALAAALPLLRQHPRAFAPLALIGAIVVFAPFALLGGGALVDYVRLVLGRGGDDLAEADYASHVLSWPGFMVALTGSLQPVAATLLSLVTLGLVGIVLRQGDRFLTWPASIIALLAVMPHSHPQDWMLTVPAAAILLARPMHAKVHLVTMALLATTFIAVNSWMISSGIVYDGGRAFYAPTPMALLLLAWCAAIPVLERMLSRMATKATMQTSAAPA